MAAPRTLPRWADVLLVPIASVATAFVIGGLVVAAIGVNPWSATRELVAGSLGDGEAIGFTLYYATDFIFTGLAVAIAFQAGLFNIGAEGQAYVAGLGVALVCLHGGAVPPWLLIPLGAIAAAAFGAAWAVVPGILQAKRGSHIVITTIMFNWLASTLMAYLLVNGLRAPGSMQAETAAFPPAATVPSIHTILAALGLQTASTPLNLSFLLALGCALATWIFVWRTRLGYELRTVGANPAAARYGGISPARITILVMALSGALAAGVAINEVMGVQNRLLLDFTAGYGFVGIAVALMGRGHPLGVVLASLLFGMLYQGGAELAFDEPKVTRDMIVLVQGLVVFFAGALEGVFRRGIAGLWSERAGIFDIGLEGKMLLSAFASALAAYETGNAWVGLAAGVLASVLLGLVHGFASIDGRGNQIVSGAAVNMIAAGATATVGHAIFGEGGRTPQLQTAASRFEDIVWPGAGTIGSVPIVGPLYRDLVSGHTILTYAALLCVPLTAFALYRTRFGLRLRATGENPAAVDTAGVSVRGMRYAAVVICGVLCGFAGSYLAVAQAAGFQPNMSAGKGFIALAALVFAKWRPWPALATCLLFGFLDAISIRLQGVVVPGLGEIPVQAIQALPYLLTVILLAGFIGHAVPPRAGGIPYVKER